MHLEVLACVNSGFHLIPIGRSAGPDLSSLHLVHYQVTIT